jgi:hypothetical protein
VRQAAGKRRDENLVKTECQERRRRHMFF